MELYVLCPTLAVGLLFSLSVLLYSLTKVAGNPFKRPAIQPVKVADSAAVAISASVDLESQAVEPPAEPTSDALEAHLTQSFPVSSLQWSAIALTVKDQRTGSAKRLLQGCAGVAFPGDLVALVGPSGAGKSTLLDVLAMRECGGTLTGSITVSGKRITQAQFRSVSTYVPQEDVFVPTLSVWETLQVTANLRLPGSFSTADKEALMAESLGNMGLAKVKNSQVGGLLPGGLSVRGLSGGEKRRLSMACGVVGAPKIIYLDEPTSGLDGNAALVVMECMGRLARQQRIIISSIHQPRAAIWELFSKVQVLSEGRMLYFGATSQVINWFSGRLNYDFDPLVHGTASEWLSDLISISFTQPPKHFRRSMRTLKDVEDAAAAFASEATSQGLITRDADLKQGGSRAAQRARNGVIIPLTAEAQGHQPQAPAQEEAEPATDMEAASSRAQPTGWCNQYAVLQWRALQAYSRNPANVAGRTLMAVFIGVIGGLVFFKRAAGQGGISQDISAIFFSTLVLALVPFTYMSMFVADRHFFIVDPARSLYRTSVYYVSLMVVNAAITVLNGAILLLVVYSMIGLRYDAKAIALSVVVAALHSLVAVQLLVFAAFVTPNQDLAFVLAVGYNVLSALLSGVWVHVANMIAPLRWLSYGSVFRYTIDAFAQIQYAQRDDGCGVMPAVTPQMQAAARAGQAELPTGRSSCDAVLVSSDQQLSLASCFGGLLVLLCIMHAASFWALSRYTKRR